MNILITGAHGFVGKNLTEALKAIRDGKDRTHPELEIRDICGYDTDNTPEQLADFCKTADFVFHLAGVNRPKTAEEYLPGNTGSLEILLTALKQAGNRCPVMLASSAQASLVGRYAGSEYGKAKRACEERLRVHAAEIGAEVLIYRFPNVFGKWCRPNYNSAVATFCHNIARDLPITVSDPATELELLYIDDLVAELLGALSGQAHRCEYDGLTPVPGERFCHVPVTHRVTLGRIVALLRSFRAQPETLLLPDMPAGSLEKKLYSTYLSYLPQEKVAFPLQMNADARGSFTELLKTRNCGQFSVNITKPGVTKGQHWHNSKWEFFIVVAGHGLIRERRLDSDEVLEFEVSGERIEAVHMLPGYTHSITNLSDTDTLVTVMWANECFDPNRPDTYFEEV